MTVSVPKDADKGVINNQEENWTFKFDKILHNASQEDVYDYCTKQAVHKVVGGFNGTILCYGQTGAGKTFTMCGSTSNYKYRGIIPRAISSIFSEVGGQFDNQIKVSVTYVEIYNETIFDLLDRCGQTKLQIREDKGQTFLENATERHVANNQEVLSVI